MHSLIGYVLPVFPEVIPGQVPSDLVSGHSRKNSGDVLEPHGAVLREGHGQVSEK